MEISNKTRRQLRIQNWIFIILFLAVIGLLGWLSTEYSRDFDWTATGRHSLSKLSIKVLEKLQGPVQITSFASGNEQSKVRQQVSDLVKRYQQVNDKITLNFVDPLTNPDETRKLGIRMNGEMIVKYQGRSEHVTNLTESDLSNALQRLIRNAERKVVVITGHGERDPKGHANYDLSAFFSAVESKGIKVSDVNLTSTLKIPADTSVVVIASPQLDYLPGEIEVIKHYLDAGGSLWWMQEPKSKANLKALADDLHVKFMNGEIVDMEISQLGVDDPTIIIGQYLPQAITKDFNLLTLYPRATGIDYETKDNWQVEPFLESVNRSWLETGEIKGTIRYDQGVDVRGPVKFGIAMTRQVMNEQTGNGKDKPSAKDKADKKLSAVISKTQRVVVMGDGDFLSNAFLGNQGNQQMGENILNWLTHDDNFIDIPTEKAPDAHLAISKNAMIVLGFVYLLAITALLIGAGVFIWLRRRNR